MIAKSIQNDENNKFNFYNSLSKPSKIIDDILHNVSSTESLD